MPVTRERFDQGMTYQEFKTRLTRNRERFEANERQLELDPADLAAFQRLPEPLNVLVLAEDWCADVVATLPILGRIAAESGKLRLRVFPRDRNLDLAEQYLKQGRFRSIPVFVFFDEQLRELGRFIERPERVTERHARYLQEVFAQHPEFGSPGAPVDQLPQNVRRRLAEAYTAMHDTLKALDARDVVDELRALGHVHGWPLAAATSDGRPSTPWCCPSEALFAR